MHVDKQFQQGTINFYQPLNNSMNFNVLLKVAPKEGYLVYEYNPFRNYRLTTDMFEYEGHLYTQEELAEMGVALSQDTLLYQAGSLVDFETDQLSFDINHPVEMLPQYSYDGSVNLILNDGKNIPRLINSRFTCVGMNRYKVIDRKGDNDTNIYDQGAQFDIDTSLYKRVVEIPELDFLGVSAGGSMPVGNYVFYFKYSDADGNETDFVAESGIVSMFVGTELVSVVGGRQDENTYKMVKFIMRNIDASYSYVNVYYTRCTSDIDGQVITTAHKIGKKYEVSKALTCQITITGYEDVIDITVEEINIQYCIASSVVAQASSQNRLFLGNIHRPDIPYKELNDLSLRFCPVMYRKPEPYVGGSFDYTERIKDTYADPDFIYNYTGYANCGEMYCFGIVYILSDNTLSPVFYVRGATDVSDEDGQYDEIPVYMDFAGVKKRVYISSDESTGEIISVEETGDNPPNYSINNQNLQNAWGIITTNVPTTGDRNDSNSVYGIKMYVHPSVRQDLFDALADIGIKGFFFVRQRRLPLIVCQALTIGVDKYSKTPVLPVSTEIMKGYHTDIDLDLVDEETCYITERFLSNDRLITNDFVDRLYTLSNNNVATKAAICPDYDCNIGYYNSIFNGSTFYCNEANFRPTSTHLSMDGTDLRHLYTDVVTNEEFDNGMSQSVDVVTINDAAPAVATSKYTWRAMAGTAEESYRFEYIERENKVDDAVNLLRGLWGNYIGIDGYDGECRIINIKSPEAINASIYDRMQTRHADKNPYMAISKRYALKGFYNDDNETIKSGTGFENEMGIIYRGDSFICTFTHRFNRNFSDPESPINDKIVDEETWANNYSVEDTENFENINRGDLNAVQMGMWVTFPVVSYRNLNIRSLDNSYPEEEALTGHKRGFYPFYIDSVEGSYKIPESMFLNQGLSVNLGCRYNYPVPDVPYIKNEFQTRILYSDVHVNDAYKNGFRVFQATHFHDYPRTYGCIIKLVEVEGGLLCVYEHGIVHIAVNERVQAGDGQGGLVYINTPNVLPDNPSVISEMFGTQWKDSVIKTPYGVYGIDTIAKKIWRVRGGRIELISDFCVQEFLNLNISLTERELEPILGIRNVKSHYNAFKQDVMFTFYDNTVGFEEKVWNLCYNELLGQWTTFYSWVPSFSANIDNIYFSFDRNTSKWISKLGISHMDNDFSYGIVLSNNIFSGAGVVGQLDLVNVDLPEIGTGISYTKEFTLERDNFGYYKMFSINGNTLSFNGNYQSLIANIFYDDMRNTGRRVFLDRNDPNFQDKIVYELNVRCKVTLNYDGNDNNIKQHVNNWNEYQMLNIGYYDCSIAVIPSDNMKFLTTDFWRHGQAGIIDIADKILPTVWYAKQHPFEFEFVVVDDASAHKMFDNLEIIGNMAEPESFHYEIVGDAYEYADDKENMYFRQEAIRALYQYNGSDILYDHDFVDLIVKQRQYIGEDNNAYYDKSTMFPLYYARTDTFNEIEDYYKGVTSPDKDYVYLSGTEVVHNKTINEYHLWTHVKATSMKSGGRLRGNMWYLEDKWYVQIPSINFVQKNENGWRAGNKEYIDTDGTTVNMGLPPLPVINSPCPNDIVNTNIGNDDFPEEMRDLGYNVNDIDVTEWSGDYTSEATLRRESRIRDKWLKVRIRYDGSKLVIIHAVKTLFTDSFV